MKRKIKKNSLIVMMSGMAVACAAFAFTFMPVTASADTYQGSFELAGASIRLATEANSSTGLRFVSTIEMSEYTTLTETYDVSVGTLIIPEAELSGKLDFDNNTDEIMHIENIAPVESVQYDGCYEFRAVVSKIPEESYGDEIIARAYMVLSDKAGEAEDEIVWTDTLSRNVAYVAYKADNDPTFVPDEDGQSAIDAFISDKAFNKVDYGEDISCDYDYAFAGQTVKVSMANTNIADVLSVTDENGSVLDTVDNTFTMPETTVTVEKINALELDLTDKRAASAWGIRSDSTGSYQYGELSFGNDITMGSETKSAMTFYSSYNYDNWENATQGSIGSYTNVMYTFLKKELIDFAVSEGYTQISFSAATVSGGGLGGRLRIAHHSGNANETIDGSNTTTVFANAGANDATSKWNTFTVDLSSLTKGTLAIMSSSDTLYISEVTLIKPETIDFTKNFASEEMAKYWKYYGSQASVTYEKNINANGSTASAGAGKDAIKLYGANHTADFQNTNNYLSGFYLDLDVMKQLKAEGYTKVTLEYSFLQDSAGTGSTYRAYIRTYVGDGTMMKHNEITVSATNALHSNKTAATWSTFTWDLSGVQEGHTFAIAWFMQTMYISSITFSK